MNNPIEIYDELRQLYIKYIHTTLPMGFDQLSEERRLLFEQSSAISQEPIIEFIPTYKQVAGLSELANQKVISEKFNEFASLGLFEPIGSSEKKLYKHQQDSLEAVHKHGKHLVITTGTGSGKTEAFMLPMLANILSEADQWKQEEKTAAVRGLILYPLNALAEDQMVRLRHALNTKPVADWLNENYRGNRITFGRYTGETPGSGKKNTEKDYLREKRDLNALWQKALRKAEENDDQKYLDFTPAINNIQTAELFHRYQIQTTPPDLLITNFSMLNIILMRAQEESIFDQTRRWLAESEENVFHLVVDELHSYRGTPGSEVAYTIRLLLRRLGLTPESPQLRILASSASMEDQVKGREFISGFFGLSQETVQNKVAIIADDPIISESDTAEVIDPESIIDPAKTQELIIKLQNILKRQPTSTVNVLSKKLFGEENLPALVELLKVVSKQKGEAKNALIKLRTHLFFRTINNLYACANPNCNQVQAEFQYKNRSIGKLYRHPNTVCDCGGVILEIFVCRFCPELFLKGYLNDGIGEGPRISSFTQKLEGENQILIYPAGIGNQQNAKTPKHWKPATFDPLTAEVHLTPVNSNAIVHTFEKEDELTKKCPSCEVSRVMRSPITRHMIGAQIISQVLGDGLLRVMRNQNGDGKTPKLIVFSDSRQGAAKLSAGIETNHYRDSLRQIIISKIKPDNKELQSVIKTLMSTSPAEWGLQIVHFSKVLEENGIQNALMLLTKAVHGVVTTEELGEILYKSQKELKDFTNEISNQFLSLGMNPAGPKPSLTVRESGGSKKPWYHAYDWSGEIPSVKSFQAPAVALDKEISEKITNEILESTFAHNRKSLEALSQGRLAINLTSFPQIAGVASSEQFLNALVRILAENFRLRSDGHRFPTSSWQRFTKSYAQAVTGLGKKEVEIPLAEARDFLVEKKILESTDRIEVTGDRLVVIPSKPGDDYYQCKRCRTMHLQFCCGVCTRCNEKLTLSGKLTSEIITNEKDYFTYLAHQHEPFRLHCEELSGQTDKDDKRNRQNNFQGIFDDKDLALPEEVDLLSVTTTMEAGVDIGGLSAVMMGNVPPQRFNYQQRVGRAGRYGQSLSIALTVARNNSHDQIHYAQTERMVSAKPSEPYLDLSLSEIAERVICKEVLHQAYSDLGLETTPLDTHGGFGLPATYMEHHREIIAWLKKSGQTISDIVKELTIETQLEKQPAQIIKSVIETISSSIKEVIESPLRYPQMYLGEKLASAGYFPMFGFPTRVRNLYTKKPGPGIKNRGGEVNRDLGMAITSFAPGMSLVKDKQVYRSIGIVGYEFKGHWRATDKPGVYHPEVYCCSNENCKAIFNDPEDNVNCKICNHPLNNVPSITPLGFCTDYSAAVENYEGQSNYVEFSTNTVLDPSSDLEIIVEDISSNLTLLSNRLPEDGKVHIFNDNNGEKYYLRRGDNFAHVISKESDPRAKPYALIATRHTGVLALNPTTFSDKIAFDTTQTWVKAAFLSYAYLVRRSICDHLDIESRELTAGYRISPYEGKRPQVFFTETLDNGAGYCSFLSSKEGKEVAQKALVDALQPEGNIYELLMNSHHMNSCDRSCYDCIREYDNQWEHHLLFWRLGLDVALLTNDKDYLPNFLNQEHWCDKAFASTTALAMKLNDTPPLGFEDITYLINGETRSYILTHPFWSESFVESLKDRAEEDGHHRPVSKSILDLLITGAKI